MCYQARNWLETVHEAKTDVCLLLRAYVDIGLPFFET